jgi:hypothetical protein
MMGSVRWMRRDYRNVMGWSRERDRIVRVVWKIVEGAFMCVRAFVLSVGS